MFAQLGNIIFENLKTFNEYSNRSSANYAEHAMLDGKPILQRTGSSLSEINISIRFHASFCNPKLELNKLKEARDQGEILPLLWGNGDVEGEYVITDIDETKEDADQQGNVLSYSISLTLKEYVTANKLQQIQHEDRQKAKAVGDKKPVAKKKTNPSTCPQTISGIVNKIHNHYSAISKIVNELGGGTAGTMRAKILHHLSAMRLLDEDLIRRCDNAASCASELPDLKTRAQNVLAEVNNFNAAASTNQVATYPLREKFLGGTCRRLKEAAQKLINQTITRK